MRRGQTLVELECPRSDLLDPRKHASAVAGVTSAEAAVRAEEERMRAARADAEYGQRNLERSRRLFENGLISRDSMERVEAAARRTAAGLRASEEAVKVAGAELARARSTLRHPAADGVPPGKIVAIRAPVDSRILKIHRESEGNVQPGEPLVEVGDPRELEVKVEALSTDAIKIGPGTPVLFERWGGDSPLEGRVRVVEPAGFTKVSSLGVEEQRVLVIVDIQPTQAALRLGDGYRLEASFTIWERPDVLQVPASSLFRSRDNGWAVFVLENGKARKREVKVGHRTGISAEILSGLSVGQKVISQPDNAIGDGVRVRPRS